jgi:tRNA G18 (ribose-2'-O)-methylase SpoU
MTEDPGHDLGRDGVVRIDDPLDPRLTDYTALTDVALRRVREPVAGLFMAESSQVIRRALRAGLGLRSVLVAPRWLPELPDVLAAARAADAPVFVAEEPVLEALTGFHLHRGALAAMHRPELPFLPAVLAGARRAVILEDLVDHTNVGALFRSAAGLGVDAVLVTPRCADPLYRRSVRVSMGTVFAVPWTRIDPWPDGLAAVRALGFTVAALGVTRDAVDLAELAADPPERLCWILGTEGDGLGAPTYASADLVVAIPMAAGVDSLNVAAAGAVAFWATRLTS